MKTPHSSLLLVLLVTVFLTASSSSCEKEEKAPPPDLSKGYPDAFTNKMSPKKLANLKKAGATIYEGQDPPALDGNFQAFEFIASASDGKRVGEQLGLIDYQFKMDKSLNNKTCLIDWAQWDGDKLISSSEGVGDTYFPMSGHGFNFSIAGLEQITNEATGEKNDYWSSYSGQVTSEGIRNWESTLYTTDKDDNITWIRIFHDTDGFLPREIIKPGGRRAVISAAIRSAAAGSSGEKIILSRHR